MPMDWRGDPFHVVLAWKWGFTDNDGNHISLILQHNTLDQEQKMGNSIKMTVTNWIDDEEACYLKKHPEAEQAAEYGIFRGSRQGQTGLGSFAPPLTFLHPYGHGAAARQNTG